MTSQPNKGKTNKNNKKYTSNLKKSDSAILTPEGLFKTLQALTDCKQLWVGYSGGLDSHVLLDLAVRACQDQSGYQVGAIHIHHGLSREADAWVDHCEAVCSALQVPLSVFWVEVANPQGQSLEEMAREARLRAFSEFLKVGECLLLGHHAEDQAETILLRLFRGAGPTGLSGMIEKVTLGSEAGSYEVLRPLLSVSKEQLEMYARERNLTWIHDETNENTRFDRNFLRHEIIPRLKARWPRVVRSVSRSAALCLETATAVQVLAASDFANMQGTRSGTLSVQSLLTLDPVRRRGVIRYWLQGQQFALPSRDHLDRIDREILQAKGGAKPRLKIDDYELRRHRGDLLVKELVD